MPDMKDRDASERNQSADAAQRHDARCETPLRLWNFRAKVFGWREEATFRRMLKHAPADGRVLDIACGTGRYTRLLLARGHQVGAIDLSAVMLAVAQRRSAGHPNILFQNVGDAEKLPFEDGSFDGVTCIRLYQRIPPEPRARMLREVRRVARDWAVLFFGITTPWLRVRQALRNRISGGRVSNPFPASPAEITRQLRGGGFEIQDRASVLPVLAGGMMFFVRCR